MSFGDTGLIGARIESWLVRSVSAGGIVVEFACSAMERTQSPGRGWLGWDNPPSGGKARTWQYH